MDTDHPITITITNTEAGLIKEALICLVRDRYRMPEDMNEFLGRTKRINNVYNYIEEAQKKLNEQTIKF